MKYSNICFKNLVYMNVSTIYLYCWLIPGN